METKDDNGNPTTAHIKDDAAERRTGERERNEKKIRTLLKIAIAHMITACLV